MSVGTANVKNREFGNEGGMISALRETFPLPEYALLPGVGDSTGMSRGREADALIMSCWPSRGIFLIGVEIKVSRSDWLRELKSPAKAEAICRFCDRWYVAVGSDDIVRDGELPPTWGLIVPKGNKLSIKRQAPELTAEPMSRGFLASILRRAAEQHQGALRAEISKARSDGYRDGRESAESVDAVELKRVKASLDALSQSVREFQEASGLSLTTWTGGRKLGEAVEFVLRGGLAALPKHLDDAERAFVYMLDNIKKHRKAVDDAKGAQN